MMPFDTPSNPAPGTMPKESAALDFKTGFLLAFVLCAVLNSMPFADAARFRQALQACEKNLPRDQHCDVQGVVIHPAPTPSR